MKKKQQKEIYVRLESGFINVISYLHRKTPVIHIISDVPVNEERIRQSSFHSYINSEYNSLVKDSIVPGSGKEEQITLHKTEIRFTEKHQFSADESGNLSEICSKY